MCIRDRVRAVLLELGHVAVVVVEESLCRLGVAAPSEFECVRYPLVLLVGFELRDLLFERLAPLLGLGGLRDLRLEVGDLLVLRGYVALVLLAVDAGLAVVVLDFALAAALAFGCGLRVALGASLRAICLLYTSRCV